MAVDRIVSLLFLPSGSPGRQQKTGSSPTEISPSPIIILWYNTHLIMISPCFLPFTVRKPARYNFKPDHENLNAES